MRSSAYVLIAVLPAFAQTPRTPDGQPDLQGVWTNATLTLFERPAELGTKEFFTEDEAAAFEKRRVEQTNVDRPEARRAGETGAYNQVWFDRGTHGVKSRRTSLVVDPPNGRVPLMTPEAQKQFDAAHAEAASHPADGPESRGLTERCILFGGEGPPLLPEPYNNDYQIIQTRGYVTILSEMNHNARIIPLDGRARPNLRGWTGNSVGHWEGQTLVVDSTNFKFNNKSRFGVAYDGWTDKNLHVTERFTRTDAETIVYRATIEDPTVYTKPWTVEMSMSKTKGPLFEYACNEGNYGLAGILGGARAAEKNQSK